MNYQASNPESLSETPERLSETKTRSVKGGGGDSFWNVLLERDLASPLLNT